MLVKGGFLGKSVGYMYEITNLILKPKGWNFFWIVIDGTRISKVCNNNNEINLTLSDDNNYQINLFVNEQKFHTSRQLFSYTLDIDVAPNVNDISEFVTFVSSMIYDH